MLKTYDEHIEWCKQRARVLLDDGDVPQAIASMLSDLGKHPETERVGKAMAMMGLMFAARGDLNEARKFVEGFQ